MRRRRLQRLRTLRAPQFASLLEKHEQCEVQYRGGKYVIVRRWNGNARGDTLHEGSELNSHGQRKVLKKLGFTNDEIDEFFG